MKWRLINTNYSNPYLNMAIDEALLESKLPVLRFYRWKPAAISIGYFQSMKNEININECKKQGIVYVRRITGGKAVLHDKELTYSFIIDEKEMPKNIIDSYKIISNGILTALNKLGIKAKMKKETNKKNKKSPAKAGVFFKPQTGVVQTAKAGVLNPSLSNKKTSICFNDSSYYEITVNNKKIVGSAQTRKQGKLLQHGSMLIDINIKKLISLFNLKDKKEIIEKTKKRVSSINNELNGRKVSYDNVAEAMKKGFEENFKIKFSDDKLRKEEIILADKLAKEKYSSKQWNLKI